MDIENLSILWLEPGTVIHVNGIPLKLTTGAHAMTHRGNIALIRESRAESTTTGVGATEGSQDAGS